MNSNRVVQETVLTATALPHQKRGRSCLMGNTAAGTIALSKKKLPERKMWVH